jgi:phage terminase small subunit
MQTDEQGSSRKKIKARWEIFVREYVVDLNGTRAAIAAGYSEKGARVEACRLLTKPNIQKMIEKLAAERAKKLEITADRVLRELGRLAFSDPRKFFNDDGTAKHISQLDDDTAASLAGLEVFEEYSGKGEDRELTGYTKKFKLADKGINLERLGRHLGIFKDPAILAGTAALRVVVEHIGTANQTTAQAK